VRLRVLESEWQRLVDIQPGPISTIKGEPELSFFPSIKAVIIARASWVMIGREGCHFNKI
jgi:hypothetical protein